MSMRSLISLFLLFSLRFVYAEPFTLPTLDPATQLDPLSRTLSHAYSMRSLEPASELGKVWGFYVGASGNITDISAVNNIFTGNKPSYIPTFDIQLGIGLPLGFVAEIAFFPGVTVSGATLSKYAGAVKWNLNKVILPDFFVDLAARASYSSGNLAYSQLIGASTVNVTYGTSIVALQGIVSKNFVFFEPFMSLGFANAAATLSGQGATSLFTTSVASAATNSTSIWFQGGFLLKLGFIGLAAEYDNVFAISSWNIKLSVRI